MRLNPNGSLDPSFGGDGIAAPPLPGATETWVASVTPLASGRIIVAGTGVLGGVDRMIVWALTPSGELDTTFNAGVGYRILPAFGTDGNFTAGAVVQPDGDIAMIASVTTGGIDGVVFQIVTATGLQGLNTVKTISDDMDPTAAALQPDGAVIVSVNVDESGSPIGATTRFTPAGVWDNTYGASGFMLFGVVAPMLSQTIAVETRADGSIIPAGHLAYASSIQMLLPTGAPNTAIDPSGITRILGPHPASIFTDLSIVGGNKTFAAGFSTNFMEIYTPFVARFGASGAVDPSFASGTIPAVTEKTGGVATAVQADGHYLVFYSPNATNQLKVVRLMGDYVAPAVITPLTVKFNALKSSQTAAKFKKFAGTAGGTGLAKVQIAIQRIDSKLLKKSKKCKFVKSTSGSTKSYKAVKGKCAPTAFLSAKGTTSWSFSLKKSLPPGKYKLFARATGAGGTQSSIVSKSLTLKKK
jgi:uncharacterized delta-60 repeat protein